MKEANGFIYDRKAEGYEGIDAACDKTVYEELIKHKFIRLLAPK